MVRIMVKWLNSPYLNNLSDIGQSRDLSMFSCGGFRVRKEEELEINKGRSGAVWTVPVNSNFRKEGEEKKEKREGERTNKGQCACCSKHSILLIN